MRQLSPEGQQIINNIAQRYQFSPDAVFSMLQSVINGNGSMAQFNHPEFGGSGQWMRSGMIMLGDMFNNALKHRVGGLCQELANLIAEQPGIANFQSQQQTNTPNASGVSLFVAPTIDSSNNWWPEDLPSPSSTGTQNNVRYAYFANSRRLAIQLNGHVQVYDTLDHQISGFSQQQSQSGSVSFTSQHGLIDVNSLPVIAIDNVAVAPVTPVQVSLTESPSSASPEKIISAPQTELDIFTTIEKLAALHAKGILTVDEFNSKKAELLARL